ncbi:TolC family protein [Pedobacter sp.]|uniref:TolC family protein n=1 Tax=Pedobacter sp. TaxID=1411316 RepID=UPI003BAC3D29
MKTLKKITLGFLLFFSINATAQETIIPEIKYADLEKYIELAKQNFPRAKSYQLRTESIKVGVTVASLSYLDIFNVSYFYRPGDRAVIDPVNPYNVNGVQFGVGVSLGGLLTKPFNVKKAKLDYEIAKLEQKDFELLLVNDVRIRYYDYIQQLSLLKLSSQIATDNKGVAESLRIRFEKGEITLDAYNQSRTMQFQSFQQKILAESTYLKSKDLLEQIIGVKLSEVK